MSSNVYLPFKIKADFKCLKWKFECSTVKSIVNIYDLSAIKLEGRERIFPVFVWHVRTADMRFFLSNCVN